MLGSESHNGGKRPVRIRFARDQAVVYKPVSLQADHLVCSLLQELTRAAGRKRLFSNPAYAPVGESYGFVAFASTAQRTHSRKSLRRFYFRFGALVAAAYALNITDLHMENVLAVGEHPTLIDFETAFYRFPDALHPTDITSTGLVEKPGRSAPSSGLQGGGSCLEWALDPRAERGLAVVGYRRARFHTANRRSDAVGRLVEPSAFRQELMDGFDFGYRLVLGERDRLRRHIQLRLETEEVRIRHILRFTSHYVVRYFQMLQPAAAPMAERRRGLRLGLAEHRSALDAPAESVLDAEVDDLLRGDVPYFWSHLDSRDLRHHGGLVQPSCFSSSPFELLEEQFRRLSEADLRDQRLILAEALA